jgi:8-oxo-dGTP pyrophosphatase MutT (NUDIX family)
MPSRGPTRSLAAPAFVISAGCVLFRHVRAREQPLQVCLLHDVALDHWLLPKGRVERGEAHLAGALRETAEETGYACRALPLDMRTRAPAVGADTVDSAEGQAAAQCTEPFMITVRELRTDGTKFIWWFAAEVADEGAPPSTERRTEDEAYRGVFVDADDACLSFTDDWEILDQAVKLVKETYREKGDT